MIQRKRRELLVLGLVYSVFIASVAYIFMMIEKTTSHFMWEYIPHHVHGGIGYCLVVSSVLLGSVFYFKKKWGNLPRTSHQMLHELQEKQTVSYQHAWRDGIVALLILISGAGVGPEAPLLAVIISFSVWQADKLRYVDATWETFQQVTWKEKVMWMCHPTRYLFSYNQYKKEFEKPFKLLLMLNGVIVFWVLMRWSDQPSFATKLGETSWEWKELILLLPLVVYGYGVSYLYQCLRKHTKRMIEKWTVPLFWKLSIGSVATLCIMNYAPVLLFSGQHSMELLVEQAKSTAVGWLLLLSFVKLVFLEVSIWSGWTGGDIFPIAFASFLNGYAISSLFPQYDSVFVILVVSLSMMIGLLEREWLAGIFISFFFPISLLPITICVCAASVGWKRWRQKTVRRD